MYRDESRLSRPSSTQQRCDSRMNYLNVYARAMTYRTLTQLERSRRLLEIEAGMNMMLDLVRSPRTVVCRGRKRQGDGADRGRKLEG